MKSKTIILEATDTVTVYNEEKLQDELAFNKGVKYEGAILDNGVVSVTGMNNQQFEYGINEDSEGYEFVGNDFIVKEENK